MANTNLLAEGFIKGTLVATPNGYKRIEELQIGDDVLSLSFSKGTICSDKIVRVDKHKAEGIIQIILGDEIIEVDEDHKFYCPLQSRWVKAQKLKERCWLIKNSSELIPINKINELAKEAEIYNISVKDSHNFLVSKHDIVVHNFFVEICAAITAVAKAIEIKIGIDVVGIAAGALAGALVDKLTNKEARQQAGEWGWEEDKDCPYNTKGQPVFKHPKRNVWRTPDIDSHKGGVWKEWDANGNRRTLDGNLKPIGK